MKPSGERLDKPVVRAIYVCRLKLCRINTVGATTNPITNHRLFQLCTNLSSDAAQDLKRRQ